MCLLKWKGPKGSSGSTSSFFRLEKGSDVLNNNEWVVLKPRSPNSLSCSNFLAVLLLFQAGEGHGVLNIMNSLHALFCLILTKTYNEQITQRDKMIYLKLYNF